MDFEHWARYAWFWWSAYEHIRRCERLREHGDWYERESWRRFGKGPPGVNRPKPAPKEEAG